MILKEEILNLIKNRGLGVYKYNDLKTVMSKVDLENNEGYRYTTTIKNLKNNKNPKWFTFENPYFEHNIKEYIKRNNINVKLIDNNKNELRLQCSCGVIYKCTWNRFYNQQQFKCNYCSRNMVRVEQLESILKERKFKLLSNYDKLTKLTKFIIMDKDGYLYETDYNSLSANTELYPIHTLNPYSSYNIKIYLHNNHINCTMLSHKYVDSNTDMEWECRCGTKFKRNWNTLLRRNHICKNCSTKNMQNRFSKKREEVISDFNSKGLCMIDVYTNTATRVLCMDKDGFYYKVQHINVASDNFKASIVDPTCSKYSILNIRRYLKLNNMTCVLKSKEYLGSGYNLKFRCECGRIYETSWSTIVSTQKSRCDKCNKRISKIALATKQYLDDNNFVYSQEYTFVNCKDKNELPFDFVVFDNHNEIKNIIEVDGVQHFLPSFGEESFNTTIIHDAIKNSYCEDNGIKLMRIPYWEFENDNYIKILNNNLM